MEGKRLLAGAAQVDMTPKMGTHLTGAPTPNLRRPAEILIDPLFAKALVLDEEGIDQPGAGGYAAGASGCRFGR